MHVEGVWVFAGMRQMFSLNTPLGDTDKHKSIMLYGVYVEATAVINCVGSLESFGLDIWLRIRIIGGLF
jgi:hypothetical protein